MRRYFSCESLLVVPALFFTLYGASAQTTTAPPTSEQKPPVSLSPAMPAATDPAKIAQPVGGDMPKGIPVDPTYVLGAEDQISVRMWGDPRWDGTYAIRPDGLINLPLLDEVKATGLTCQQLQAAIDKAALKVLTTPRSTVTLLAVHSKHVYFDGEGIAAPGAMDLTVPIRLFEAISTRGGFKDFANKNKIVIIRDGKQFMTVKYKDMISGKHPEANPLLLDKDHVLVN